MSIRKEAALVILKGLINDILEDRVQVTGVSMTIESPDHADPYRALGLESVTTIKHIGKT